MNIRLKKGFAIVLVMCCFCVFAMAAKARALKVPEKGTSLIVHFKGTFSGTISPMILPVNSIIYYDGPFGSISMKKNFINSDYTLAHSFKTRNEGQKKRIVVREIIHVPEGYVAGGLLKKNCIGAKMMSCGSARWILITKHINLSGGTGKAIPFYVHLTYASSLTRKGHLKPYLILECNNPE